MKRIVLTALMGTLAAGAAFAQGTITMGNNATTPFQTNAVATGGTSGSYTASSGLYDFELLTAASTVTTIDSSLQGLLGGTNSSWSDTGAGAVSAGLAGRISSSATTANFWPAGAQESYIIIGWSASIGNFAALEADLAGASLVAHGAGFQWTGGSLPIGDYVGATTIQSAEAGGGASGLPPFALFGTTASGQGTPIMTATELYVVAPIPEPTTFALAGLGAAAMLIFRRRK